MKKLHIIYLIFILMILLITMMTVKSNAATVSMTASSTNVTVGTTVTISVSGVAASWDVYIEGNGLERTPIVGFNQETTNMNFSGSASFTPTKAGTYTINLTGTIVDETQKEGDKVNQSVTITVREKSSGGNNSDGGNTSGGNTSSGENSESGSSSGGNNSSSGNENSENNSSSTPTFREVNETVYSTGSINVRASYSTSSSVVGSLSEGQSVTRTGIGSNGWSRVRYNGQTAYISSSLLTTTKPEEPENEPSDNNDLSSLTIDGVTLSPEFNKDVTEYTANVGEEIANLIVSAVAENSNAEVEVTGNENLQMGENTVTITVTSEAGETKTYTIRVTKGEVVATDDTLKLQSLEIAGVNFDGQFSPDTYSYELNLSRYVENLDITATANQEDATIEIIGNENLIEGENTITILLTSADGEETATYQIKAVLPPATTATQNNTQFYMICAGVAIAVIVIVVIIVVIYKKRKNNAYIDDEEDDDVVDYGAFQPKFEPNKQEEDNQEEEKAPSKANRRTTKDKDVTLDDFLSDDSEEVGEKPKRPRGKHSV